MKASEYRIGQWVRVKALAIAKYDDAPSAYRSRKRRISRFAIHPMVGQVVGMGYRQEGVYHPSYESDDPAHLEVSKVVPVVLVRFGMSNRSWAVLKSDIERVCMRHTPERGLPWQARDPRVLRELMEGESDNG